MEENKYSVIFAVPAPRMPAIAFHHKICDTVPNILEARGEIVANTISDEALTDYQDTEEDQGEPIPRIDFQNLLSELRI